MLFHGQGAPHNRHTHTQHTQRERERVLLPDLSSGVDFPVVLILFRHPRSPRRVISLGKKYNTHTQQIKFFLNSGGVRCGGCCCHFVSKTKLNTGIYIFTKDNFRERSRFHVFEQLVHETHEETNLHAIDFGDDMQRMTWVGEID